MSRWLLIPLALAAAAGAWFALMGDGLRLPIATGPSPLDEIDDDSRRRLERVLEEAEPAADGGDS